MRGDYVGRCQSCKWAVLGKYDKRYGGRPIGCDRPTDIKKKGFGRGCGYEAREDKE